MAGGPRIDRPVFLIGCGRSGTTLLYDLLCGHEDLAWFSNWSDRVPSMPASAAMGRLYAPLRRRGITRRGLPQPSEGYRLWDSIRGPAPDGVDRPLTEVDVESGDRERARKILSSHLRFMGRARFVNKNTRNVRRMRYLNGLFPDSRFIHITRDPRAATASLLRVAFWRELPIWFRDNITPQQWVADGRSETQLAAEVWAREMEVALDHQDAIPGERFLAVRYEDLVRDTAGTLGHILEFAQLRASRQFDAFVGSFEVSDANAKLSTRLTPDQVQLIEDTVEPIASTVGYPARG